MLMHILKDISCLNVKYANWQSTFLYELTDLFYIQSKFIVGIHLKKTLN